MKKQELKRAVEKFRDSTVSIETLRSRSFAEGANTAYEIVLELIDKLDEPEKVVVPQFVADYIEKCKNADLTMLEWFTFNRHDEREDTVAKWLYNNTDDETNQRREFMLIDAIRQGYEIEKEPAWVVKYREGFFCEEIKFGCGIDGDWVDELERAHHFVDKDKAEAVALLIYGTVEEVTE